jgi:hypothetical protein
MMITKLNQEANKTAILNLWGELDKSGVALPELSMFTRWLSESDFFTAPSSTMFHLACEGGLALHSLHVYTLLKEKADRYKIGVSESTLTICGLGHDICKVNYYGTEFRNKKINGRWESVEVYVVKDQYPFGHGEKSVSILQEFFKLTNIEKLAIRYHMGAWESGPHFSYSSGQSFNAACNVHPLIPLLATADYEASQLLEREEG